MLAPSYGNNKLQRRYVLRHFSHLRRHCLLQIVSINRPNSFPGNGNAADPPPSMTVMKLAMTGRNDRA